MLNWIRYRFLMRRLRGEIAGVVNGGKTVAAAKRIQKMKTPVATACKACGNIV